MIDLDNLDIYRKFDPSNMLSQLHGLSKQCLDAWHKAINFTLPGEYSTTDKVVILGMGGSAIGGDLVRSLLSSVNSKPIIFVNREYDLPNFIDTTTLVIASSYSGNTEETLSAFRYALERRCNKLAITTGGRLNKLAESAKVPVFLIDHVSQPRAALGYSFIPLIAFLNKLGLLEDKAVDVEEMTESLERLTGELKENVPASSNPAKQLATDLYGKIPIIYGGGILSEVARRWKTQINENSKTWAFYEVFPELNHNSVIGYQFPLELATKLYVLLLRCPSLHHRILIRYQITSELLKQYSVNHRIIDSQGDHELSQMMSLIFLGDWVSYYLAMLYNIDPTPVKAIDYLKKRLTDVQ